MKKITKQLGFTLLELLIGIAIVGTLAAIVFVALDPATRFTDARNSNRWVSVNSILDAVKLYQVDNGGSLPSGINTTLKMIGADGVGCDEICGSSAEIEIAYHNSSESLSYYSNNSYSVRNWFDVSSISNFESITVSTVLDCNESCSGNVRVRIGNASSYNDYDLVDSSLIRTDGTTIDYSWYSNTYAINKSTLGDDFFVQLLIYTDSGTIRFMMDEVGPAGPDPEFRSGSNGDGSQTGWINDNGDYFIKIALSESSIAASSCIDLSTPLASYLQNLPQDPENGSVGKTYFAVKQTSSGLINVISCSAELNENISKSR